MMMDGLKGVVGCCLCRIISVYNTTDILVHVNLNTVKSFLLQDLDKRLGILFAYITGKHDAVAFSRSLRLDRRSCLDGVALEDSVNFCGSLRDVFCLDLDGTGVRIFRHHSEEQIVTLYFTRDGKLLANNIECDIEIESDDLEDVKKQAIDAIYKEFGKNTKIKFEYSDVDESDSAMYETIIKLVLANKKAGTVFDEIVGENEDKDDGDKEIVLGGL